MNHQVVMKKTKFAFFAKFLTTYCFRDAKIYFVVMSFYFALFSLNARAQSDEEILLFENFNNISFNSLGRKLVKDKNIDLIESKGADGSAVIRVAYVGFDEGSQRVTLKFPLKRSVKQATLSFDVLFDKDFQWTYGGKLHGLGPKVPVTGGKKRNPGKWSARTTFKKEGYVSTYLYDQDKKNKYGVGSISDVPVFSKTNGIM